MARSAREILGPATYDQMVKDLRAAEAHLETAQESYDLAVRMGIAKAADNAALQETKRKLAQMKAGLGL